jgi:GAF domain
MPYESLPVVRAVQTVLDRATNPDDAVTGVLEAIGDSMGWLVGGFWVPEGDDGTLAARCVWAARIHKGTSFAEETKQMRLPAGAGLPGRVWTRGETVWIEDVGEDAGEDGDFPHAAAVRIAGLHAAVGFPVQHEGRMLGVLEFFTDVLRAPVEALLPVFDEIGREIGAFVARQRAWAPRDPGLPAEPQPEAQTETDESAATEG